jgi:subtilase family serine protease
MLTLASTVSLPAMQTLKGCLSPEFAAASRIGDLDPSTSLSVDLGLPLPDPAGLDAFIATLYDPHSPNYRRFLSPQDFADRFGPSKADYQALIDFARAQGLTISATHTSRLLLQVRGRAAQIERTFHVSLGRRRRADGTQFFAPDNEPSVDLDLPGLNVSGLDNFSRWHSRAHRHPRNIQNQTPNHGGTKPLDGTGGNSTWGWAYQGDDFRDAYVPGVSLQGAGQSIGLVEFGGFYSQDISTYETSSNPPLATSGTVTTVSTDGYNENPLDNGDDAIGGPEGDCAEVSLDIELALSMAPQADIVVYEAYDTDAMSVVLAAIADNPVCYQISCSWGGGTLSGMGSNAASLLAELAAQGQGFFNASGDSGAYSSENTDASAAGPVGYPDSLSPYITEVGGTNLTTAGPSGSPAYISYTSESTWNDYDGSCGSSGGFGGASGGGFCSTNSETSSILDIPSYQAGVSMSLNGGSTTYRNVPDVSALAENFWVVYCDKCPAVPSQDEGAGQQEAPFDGTSGASPLWTAFISLANEQASLDDGRVLGFANPTLYSLAEGPDYTSDFHDIADNSNNELVNTHGQSCDPVYYNAVAGYDLCTGWGSPNGQALIQDLVGIVLSRTVTPTFSASPTITPTSSDSPTKTATSSHSPTISPSITPTYSPSLTITPTSSDSPTGTATSSHSPTISPTFSHSPTDTPSVSPCPTVTATASASPTVTPTFSVSPTATRTFTPSPSLSPTTTRAYMDSGQGRTVLAPNPVISGQPLSLYFSAQPSRALWQVYDLAGQEVAKLDITGGGPYALSTRGLAPGIYLAYVTVDYAAGGGQLLALKFAVVR